MPHAALTPVVPIVRAALLSAPPTAAKPRGTPCRAATAEAHAAHSAGLRAPAKRFPQGAPTPGPTAPFKPFRTDPLNREPTAKPVTAPFKPFRIDPLNREPTAKTAATARMTQHRTEGNRVKEARSEPRPDLASFTRLPWVVNAPPLPPAHPPCQNRTT
jgi:hypothetical protein